MAIEKRCSSTPRCRVVAAAEEEAPKLVCPQSQPTVPGGTVRAEAGEAGMAAAYYMPGAIDGSRQGTYYLDALNHRSDTVTPPRTSRSTRPCRATTSS